LFYYSDTRLKSLQLVRQFGSNPNEISQKLSNENENTILSNLRMDNNESESLNLKLPIHKTMFELPKLIDEVAESKAMVKKIRILCWIMTSPKSHNKAKVVRETWGRRCNILVFISSEEGRDILF
jgi:hypothetical protein